MAGYHAATHKLILLCAQLKLLNAHLTITLVLFAACRTVLSMTGATTSAAASWAHWAGRSAPPGRRACRKPSTGECACSAQQGIVGCCLSLPCRDGCACTCSAHAQRAWTFCSSLGAHVSVKHSAPSGACYTRAVSKLGVALLRLARC